MEFGYVPDLIWLVEVVDQNFPRKLNNLRSFASTKGGYSPNNLIVII